MTNDYPEPSASLILFVLRCSKQRNQSIKKLVASRGTQLKVKKIIRVKHNLSFSGDSSCYQVHVLNSEA